MFQQVFHLKHDKEGQVHNNRHEPTSGPQQPFKCFEGGEEDRSSDGNDSDDDGDDDDDDL